MLKQRQYIYCERFEPRSHFKSRLSLIVRVNVVLNRTVVVDSDWRFDNLCVSHLQSQSELYHVSWWYCTLVIDLIGQLCRDVVGRLSVKPWCYWLWRLGISNWCVSIRLLSQLNSRLLLVKLSVLQSLVCSQNTPKRDHEHPHPFHMRSPPPRDIPSSRIDLPIIIWS